MTIAFFYSMAQEGSFLRKYINKRSDKNDASYMREDLWNMLPIYQKIRDCLRGQEAIKERRDYYLPIPNAHDKSDKNVKRYNAYLNRAIFSNFLAQTMLGLLGQCYIYDPDYSKPSDILKPTFDRFDGDCNVIQFSKKSLGGMLAFARGGLLTDYPVSIGREISLRDKMQGIVKPNTLFYEPEQITSYDDIEINGIKQKSYISLTECYNETPNQFKPTPKVRIRVLKLQKFGSEYAVTIEIHKKNSSGNFVQVGASIIPRVNNKPFNYIEDLFTFLGSSENSDKIQIPQTSALADLNIGHYCNSADYENSCFTVGQPTLVISGLTQSWYDDNLKDGVKTGSNSYIPLESNSEAYYLQTEPNSMPFEAMKYKESQMISLGAKLIQPSSVVKTATESTMDKSDESSLLTSTSGNCSEAMQKHLKLSYYMLTGKKEGKEYDDIKFKIRTESTLMNLTSVEQTALIQSWMANAISDDEMREQFFRAGIATDRKYVPKKVKPVVAASSSPKSGIGKKPGKSANGTTNTTTGKGLAGNKV